MGTSFKSLIFFSLLFQFEIAKADPIGNSYSVSELHPEQVILVRQLNTHKRNYIIDFDSMSLTYIGSGEVTPNEDGTLLVRWEKGYFNRGGAYWYDVVKDSNGNLLSVMDHHDANHCIPNSEFSILLSSALTENLNQINATNFCVYVKQ